MAVGAMTMPASLYAERTISADYTLTANEDWTADGMIRIANGVTIDLAGYSLKVHAIVGAGTVTSSVTAFSDLTGGGTVSDSGDFATGYTAANLFDKNTGTLAYRGSTSGNPLWVVYDFGSAQSVNRYRLYAATPVAAANGGYPKEWTFEGSNDNSVWTVLDSRTDETLSNGNWYDYDFPNDAAYRYYRLKVTKGSRWDSSAAKDRRLDLGGELEIGWVPVNRLVVEVTGTADCDFSGLTVGENVNIALDLSAATTNHRASTVAGLAGYTLELAGGTLAADIDLGGLGKVALAGTLDLAGHSLKVDAIVGEGAVTSSVTAFSDLTGSGTVSDSGDFATGYTAVNLFDKDTGTLAYRGSTSGNPLWVVYDFGSERPVNRYRLYAATPVAAANGGYPKEWTFEGSNDNSDWTVLDSRTDETLSNGNWYDYDFQNDAAYRYYRLKVTKGSRWDSSTSKDRRLDLGGELEIGWMPVNKVYVNVSGLGASDVSGIHVSSDAAIAPADDFVLEDDLDMGGISVSCMIDLNGHALTVSALSGGGVITDTSYDAEPPYFSPSGGTVIADGGDGTVSNPGDAFDGDTGTFAYRGQTTGTPFILGYDFGTATAVNRYRIYAYTSVRYPGFPTDWTFEGSNDGVTWTLLDSRTGETLDKDCWHAYDFAAAAAYSRYRIKVTKGSRWNGSADPRIDLGELQFGRRCEPGRVVVDVPGGATAENTDVRLTGNVRLVKEGTGTLVVSKEGQSYLGGTEVCAGTLTCGVANAGVFGPDGSGIDVAEGGTFDTNGKRANGVDTFGKYVLCLDGGKLKNGGAGVGDGNNYENVTKIVLTGDSELEAEENMFIGTQTAGIGSRIDLGGNVLSCSIADGKVVRLYNVTMENGSFSVTNENSGRLFIGYNGSVVATNVDFALNCPVVVRNDSTFKVRDYESLGGSGNNTIQYGAMEVYGAFRPTSDCFYGCTLMDGSTLDLSTRETTLNALSAATGGCTNLAFEADATVNVSLGARRANRNEPILSWTEATKPGNVETVKFVCADDRKYAFVVKADGLYAYNGLVIIVR